MPFVAQGDRGRVLAVTSISTVVAFEVGTRWQVGRSKRPKATSTDLELCRRMAKHSEYNPPARSPFQSAARSVL